jgi:hypothetical protein
MLPIKDVSGEFAPKVGIGSLLHLVNHLGQHAQAQQQRQDVTFIASVALRHRKRGPLTSSVDNTRVTLSVIPGLLKRAHLV